MTKYKHSSESLLALADQMVAASPVGANAEKLKLRIDIFGDYAGSLGLQVDNGWHAPVPSALYDACYRDRERVFHEQGTTWNSLILTRLSDGTVTASAWLDAPPFVPGGVQSAMYAAELAARPRDAVPDWYPTEFGGMGESAFAFATDAAPIVTASAWAKACDTPPIASKPTAATAAGADVERVADADQTHLVDRSALENETVLVAKTSLPEFDHAPPALETTPTAAVPDAAVPEAAPQVAVHDAASGEFSQIHANQPAISHVPASNSVTPPAPHLKTEPAHDVALPASASSTSAQPVVVSEASVAPPLLIKLAAPQPIPVDISSNATALADTAQSMAQNLLNVIVDAARSRSATAARLHASVVGNSLVTRPIELTFLSGNKLPEPVPQSVLVTVQHLRHIMSVQPVDHWNTIEVKVDLASNDADFAFTHGDSLFREVKIPAADYSLDLSRYPRDRPDFFPPQV